MPDNDKSECVVGTLPQDCLFNGSNLSEFQLAVLRAISPTCELGSDIRKAFENQGNQSQSNQLSLSSSKSVGKHVISAAGFNPDQYEIEQQHLNKTQQAASEARSNHDAQQNLLVELQKEFVKYFNLTQARNIQLYFMQSKGKKGVLSIQDLPRVIGIPAANHYTIMIQSDPGLIKSAFHT
jgi:hypothetical protein